MLGTSSCISTQTSLSDACDSATKGVGTPSAVDLFRYSSAGHLVLDSSLSTTAGAYFSYNGGTTNGAKGEGGTAKFYNTLANGEDYADYVPSSPSCRTNLALQDESGCPGSDKGSTILNDGGSEVNILTAVGYSVPSSSLCTTANPNPNPNPLSFVVRGDFNGDCKSDILWRNTNGAVYTWLMNGTAISSQGTAGAATSGWNIIGSGGFQRGRQGRRTVANSTTGQVYIWLDERNLGFKSGHSRHSHPLIGMGLSGRRRL